MHITRVQRWVMSSLVLTLVFAHSAGVVLAALYSVDDDRPGAKVGLLVMAAILNLGGIVGVRLINERTWLTPWLVAAVAPSLVGGYFLTA